YNAQSLERGLFVLAYLRDSAQTSPSLAEIAAGLALSKSTVHRLLTTLVRHGYAAQDPATKRYRLGLAFLSFGHRVVEQLDVRRRGYAVNDEETYPGVRYAAAPIFDAQGEVVASISLGAPVIRAAAADLPRMGAQIQRAADRVSASLGYAPALRSGTLRR